MEAVEGQATVQHGRRLSHRAAGGRLTDAIVVAALALALVTSLIPGFPGSALAMLAALVLHDAGRLPDEGLALAGLMALGGGLGQAFGPVLSVRAAGGSAGAATGAGVGACLGVLSLVPGAPWIGAIVGAIVGALVASRGAGVGARLRAPVGALGGCLVSVVIDLVAVLGVAGVLALASAGG